MKDSVSLYIHFPFCVRKCNYCSFYSVAYGDGEIFDKYTNAVIKRINSLPRHQVRTVYFGGGTPTVLGVERLNEILETVVKTQSLDQNAEITLEANPKTVKGNDFNILRDAGFNRLSLGFQSGDEDTLKLLGRIYGANDFYKCYDEAYKHFTNISVDIMFALPYDKSKGYSIKPLCETLEALTAMKVPHISAYSLILEEGTPLYRNKSSYAFPDENREEDEYTFICSYLSDEGYQHYEISSFSLPGFESRHNPIYWKRGSYIGIGPAAHSYYNNRRFSAPPDIDYFIKNADRPFLADTDYDFAKEITPDEAEKERIMLGLRTSDGVLLEREKLIIAEKLSKAGFGSLKDNVFSLNDKGFRVSNSVITLLI